jgi:virginiamycin B lyase
VVRRELGQSDRPNRTGANSDKAVITEYWLPVPQSHPNGIAVGGDSDVYSTEPAARRIGRITPQGQMSEMVLPVGGPALDIVADREGTIWITCPRRMRFAAFATVLQ